MANGSCPFCQKLSDAHGFSKNEEIWDFTHSVAILGPWQFYHGYCLLIARRHASELNELDERERRAFLEEMCVLAEAIQQTFRPRKLNYELLGNQVSHLHWHLFPRYETDADRLKPVWLTLDRAESDPVERRRLENGPIDRAATIEKLRRTLNQQIDREPLH